MSPNTRDNKEKSTFPCNGYGMHAHIAVDSVCTRLVYKKHVFFLCPGCVKNFKKDHVLEGKK